MLLNRTLLMTHLIWKCHQPKLPIAHEVIRISKTSELTNCVTRMYSMHACMWNSWINKNSGNGSGGGGGGEGLKRQNKKKWTVCNWIEDTISQYYFIALVYKYLFQLITVIRSMSFALSLKLGIVIQHILQLQRWKRKEKERKRTFTQMEIKTKAN